MRIAFTSCMSTDSYTDQPVWDQIAALDPPVEVLVLLGDSVYVDVPAVPDSMGHTHPSDIDYNLNDFATLLLTLYQRQWAVPQFQRLVTRPGLRTFAIWDDHDFLGDDSGSQRDRDRGMAIYAANLLRCWREALQGVPLPASVSDARVQANTVPPVSASTYDAAMPGYECVELAPGLLLHLTDGRAWRHGKNLLGPAQRAAIRRACDEHPGALHLLASGSTRAASHFDLPWPSGWERYPEDHAWLLALAAQHQVLMLSGDIHRNNLPPPVKTGERVLREFTASGAAVNFSPLHGKQHDPGDHPLNYSQKFGVLDVDAHSVRCQLHNHGAVQFDTGPLPR